MHNFVRAKMSRYRTHVSHWKYKLPRLKQHLDLPEFREDKQRIRIVIFPRFEVIIRLVKIHRELHRASVH